MDSKYNVVQVSQGPACVHRYYDIPCLSPDESKMLYFRFDNGIPGPGEVILADPDGKNPENIAHADGKNIGHVGGSATWIDNNTITYTPMGEGVRLYSIMSLKDRSQQEIKGNIRQVHQGTRQALILTGNGDLSEDEFERRRRTSVLRLDLDSLEMTPLFTIEDAAKVHPLDLDLSRMNFMNCKWAPDGSKFSIVFTDEIYRKFHGGKRTTKCLILANADGSDIRYIGEFGHHPLWTPDGTGIIAHNLKPEGGQDLVKFDLTGEKPEILIKDYIACHSTMNKAGTHVITDGFNFPEKGKASVLRYDLKTGEREILCTGSQAEFDHTNHCHVHPQFNSDESMIYFNMEDTGRPQVYALELM